MVTISSLLHRVPYIIILQSSVAPKPPDMNEISSAEAAPPQEPVPTYRIDLSLPPSERYTQLATDFAPKMKDITPLFDEVLAFVIPWAWLRRVIEWLSTLVLRRVYSSEETQELKGIAKASGVDFYFLVALNVLIDSMMACTSGGVLTKPEKRKEMESNPSNDDMRTPTMMHFRTLDWGMDELRSVLVVLEFVKSKSETPEKVIARTITYAGFVGVLTGVRYVFCSVLVLSSANVFQTKPLDFSQRPTHSQLLNTEAPSSSISSPLWFPTIDCLHLTKQAHPCRRCTSPFGPARHHPRRSLLGTLLSDHEFRHQHHSDRKGSPGWKTSQRIRLHRSHKS